MAVKDFPFVHSVLQVLLLLTYVNKQCIFCYGMSNRIALKYFFLLVLKVVDSFHIAGGVTNGINIRIQRSEAHLLNEG